MKNEEIVFEKNYLPDTGTFNIEITKENKKLRFIFGGNGDLSISLLADFGDDTFEITKENYELYSLFDKMFKVFKECNVAHDNEFDDFFGRTSSAEKTNNDIRNSQLYKELFYDESINYRSDNYIYEEATIFKMSPGDDKYVIEFIGHQEDELMPNIEVTNSGSRYGYLHMPFMDLYNSLCQIDPIYHQIDIEEYMYVKKKKYKKC